MQMLKRVVRYLKGSSEREEKVVMKIRKDHRPGLVKLDGYVDSDWATDEELRKSQTSYKIEADGASMHSKSCLQTIHAGASGIAEYYAGCSGGRSATSHENHVGILWV